MNCESKQTEMRREESNIGRIQKEMVAVEVREGKRKVGDEMERILRKRRDVSKGNGR